MRRLVLQMQMSVDGFVATPDRDVSWIFDSFDDSAVSWIVASLQHTGLHVMGGKTYRDMAAHWPTSTEPFAPLMNAIPKLVFSRSLERADWPETEIARGDLAAEIARRKKEPGGDMLAHGGVSFARSLIRLGLVDEYRLVVHPAMLGRGLSIFSDLPARRDLTLVESRSFPKGSVVQIYRPA
jgi:dihydrofolate reductase